MVGKGKNKNHTQGTAHDISGSPTDTAVDPAAAEATASTHQNPVQSIQQYPTDQGHSGVQTNIITFPSK